MMNDDNDECIHGLGPISACTICNGREQREATERDRVVASMLARYTSTLACGHTPDLGDVICKTADDRYICADCAVASK